MIGSLEIEPIHVDHSVPGAYGFIIYTSEGPLPILETSGYMDQTGND